MQGSRCGRRPSCARSAVTKVPPLPKLHSRGPLVTTELSKPIFKSTVAHDFDLSRPIKDAPFREYNPLHDRHTRAFFHRPSMCLKLQKSGFVTEDLRVVCTLKEYNAYREFMESESMKMRKKQEESEREKQEFEKAVVKEKVESEVEKTREKRCKKFFKEQERKLLSRQRQMRRVQSREQQERLTAANEKKLMKERNEIRREAEREQRHLSKLQQEHQEALEKRRQLRSSENQMLVRLLQLQHSRQSHRLQQIKELESKWQAYDNHVQKAREEEEKKKVEARKEKERKRLKRKKIVQLMRAKKEARRRQLHEQTCQQVEELKKQADEHEKMWQEKKEHEVTVWREKIHREQEHWQHHMQHKLESCHTQHQKEMDDILHHSYLPNCAKTTGGPSSKWAGKSSAPVSLSHLHNRQTVVAQQKKSRDGLKLQQRKKSVRFQDTASIHIIEEDELGLEGEAPTPTPTTTTNSSAAGDCTTVASDESVQKDKEEMQSASGEPLMLSKEDGVDGETKEKEQGKKEEEEGEKD